ncbi:RidA family protein [Patescibacteria group bacterium]|nr:RidA family protein [Patescibacteria group bacterium]MBU1891060.1 RidA family protein [Patescibacteria group bacterium]
MAHIGSGWNVPKALRECCKGASYSPAAVLPEGAELVDFAGIVDTPDEPGGEVSSDLATQIRRVFAELERRLGLMGLDKSNVVHVHAKLACSEGEFGVFNREWIAFWGDGKPPVRDALGVLWVPGKGTKFEIIPVVYDFSNYPDQTSG